VEGELIKQPFQFPNYLSEVGDRINLRHTSGKSDKVKSSKLSANGLSPAAILISLSAAVGVVMTGLGIGVESLL
jgi:hypothetical protein